MKKLEYAAEKAIDWFEYNGMKLNSSKCHLLICGHKYESMIAKIGNEQIINRVPFYHFIFNNTRVVEPSL